MKWEGSWCWLRYVWLLHSQSKPVVKQQRVIVGLTFSNLWCSLLLNWFRHSCISERNKLASWQLEVMSYFLYVSVILLVLSQMFILSLWYFLQSVCQLLFISLMTKQGSHVLALNSSLLLPCLNAYYWTLLPSMPVHIYFLNMDFDGFFQSCIYGPKDILSVLFVSPFLKI